VKISFKEGVNFCARMAFKEMLKNSQKNSFIEREGNIFLDLSKRSTHYDLVYIDEGSRQVIIVIYFSTSYS